MRRGYQVVRIALVLLVVMGIRAMAGAPCAIVVEPGGSVQDAIDTVPQGAVVCLPQGTWEANLHISRSLVLRGQGAASLIRVADPSLPVLHIAVLEDEVGVDVVVEALAVVGAREEQGTWVPTDEEPLAGPPGILVAGATHVVIRDCHVHANFDGLRLTDRARVEITGNVIRSNVAHGIYSDAVHKASGSENRMFDNGVDLARNVSAALRVPLVAATERQISFPDDRYPTLQHAVDALLPGGTLTLREGSHPAGVTITKAMDLTAEMHAQVTLRGRFGGADILALGTTHAGPPPGVAPVLSLVGEAQVRCRGITVAHNARGICLRDAAQAIVSRALVGANGLGGGVVLWDTSRAAVHNSTIATEGAYAFRVHDRAKATISACAVLENHHGIWLTDAARATITGCTVAYNTGLPTIFVSGAAQAAVNRCTVYENRAVGVAFVQDARGAVRHTTIGGNLHGIGLSGRADVDIAYTHVYGNVGYGVFLQEPCTGQGAFAGRVTGRNNSTFGATEQHKHEANVLCPPELMFLLDELGGALDLRP